MTLKSIWLLTAIVTTTAVTTTALANDCDLDQAMLGIESEIKANAGCIVIRDGKLLVIQSPTRKISIPGGSAHKDETAVCTAIRETQEETGLEVTPTKLAKVWENGFYIFECDAASRKTKRSIRQAVEVHAIHWITTEEFDNYRWRYEKQQDWLKSYLNSKQLEK